MNSISTLADNYLEARARVYARGQTFSLPAKLGLALAVAFLTGAAAQLRLPLPGTPVPVTGQVFVVLLAGVLLGRTYGPISMALYLGIGAAGVPWFNAFSGGPSVLTGVTAGYLIGFLPAALLAGWTTHRFEFLRRPPGILVVMTAAVAVIYLTGAAWFARVTGAGVATTISGAVLPFIGWDLAKAFLATGIASVLLPKNEG